jgi:D-serine dehydratase
MVLEATTLHALAGTPIDHRYKGIPLGTELTLAEIGAQGWNVARGDLALPVTTLRQSALENNIEAMSEYCRRNGVLLAPHGKTTMAPQLFQRQIDAGAWGITAATPTQIAVMREFGVKRILLANEISEPESIKWIARELEADGTFEFMCLVDSSVTVAAMDQALDGVLEHRKFEVLVELGFANGRAGVRDHEEAMRVARSVRNSRHLALAGVETYEGLLTTGIAPSDLEGIKELFADVRRLVRDISVEGLFETSTITVTAGGSAYFDLVVLGLSDWSGSDLDVRLILRSGCYVTHDSDRYQVVSPLDGRRGDGETLRLENALEGWATVLSRPEPGLAILGTGKRDLPYDLRLPIPLRAYPANGSPPVDLRGHGEIFQMMDQHAFMTLPDDFDLQPGAIVVLGMSHPCTAFDKMRLLPIIDDNDVVVDGVLTFF